MPTTYQQLEKDYHAARQKCAELERQAADRYEQGSNKIIRGIQLFLESDMRQNNIPCSTYDYVLNILDKARS